MGINTERQQRQNQLARLIQLQEQLQQQLQELNAERQRELDEQTRLEAECERLKQVVKQLEEEREAMRRSLADLQAERDDCQMTAIALALEHLSPEQLERFSVKGYTRPLTELIEELERQSGGGKHA
jgi:chromosome segregation ATPase